MGLGNDKDVYGEDLDITSLSYEEVVTRLRHVAQAEEAEDPKWSGAYAAVLTRVLSLLVKALVTVEGSAALVVVAPEPEIERIDLEQTDGGELTQELSKVTVFDVQFQQSLADAAWCYDGDVDTRGRPTEGGFVVNHTTGQVVAASVSFAPQPTGLLARLPGAESMSAVDLAASLGRGVVFTRTKQGVVTAFSAAEVQWGRALQVKTVSSSAVPKGAEQRDNIELAVMLDNLGLGHLQKGNPGAAKQLHERALRIQEGYYGPNHIQVAVTLDNLGIANTELGHPEVGKQQLERALRIHETHFGANHVQVAYSLDNLGTCLRELGALKQAQALHERSLGIYQAHYGMDHAQLGRTLNSLGHVHRGLGNPAMARQMYERALLIHEKDIDPDKAQLAITMNNLGNAYRELGDVARARSLYERALSIAEGHFGSSHVEVARTLNNLGLAYQEQGDAEHARPMFERALDIFEMHLGTESLLTAMAQTNFASCMATLGHDDEALKCIAQAERAAKAAPHRGVTPPELLLRGACVRYGAGDTGRPTPQERWQQAEEELQRCVGPQAVAPVVARCREGLLRTWQHARRPDVVQWLQSGSRA